MANRVLHLLECRWRHRSNMRIEHPPVFIVGAPRSGSTLLYQVMVQHFDLGYLSNFHCLFYGAPSLAEKFFTPLRRKQTSDYASQHGATFGWSSPSECGDYWYRFFRRSPQYVTLEDVSADSLRCLRTSIRALGLSMKKPVLFKNLMCVLRLGPLIKALPESLFIVIQRDWVDTAHSILEARMKLHGDYDHWHSAEPPGFERLKTRPCHEQVIEQIRYMHSLISDARHSVPSRQIIDVSYEDLCRNPKPLMERLSGFFSSNSLVVDRTGDIPDGFEIKKDVRIDMGVYESLKAYYVATCGDGSDD